MPRKGKGGPRSGNPGTSYTNRTDLAADTQPVAVPIGQTYGEAGRQQAAMSAIGIPDLEGMLGSMPGLTDPSQRPEEPLTAGMPMGPGPGAVGPPKGEGGLGLLRRMVAESPDPELFDLLAEIERTSIGAPARMMPTPHTQPGGAPIGNNSGVSAGSLGAPTGTMFGRIASREGQQLASGVPDTNEG